MGKAKRPPARGFTFMDRLQESRHNWRVASEETERQFMADMLAMTLNDPEYMGKDVFGYKRLCRVMEGVMRYHDLFHDALDVGPESEYMRTRLDDRLRQIVPAESFSPFYERYEWIEEKPLK